MLGVLYGINMISIWYKYGNNTLQYGINMVTVRYQYVIIVNKDLRLVQLNWIQYERK